MKKQEYEDFGVQLDEVVAKIGEEGCIFAVVTTKDDDKPETEDGTNFRIKTLAVGDHDRLIETLAEAIDSSGMLFSTLFAAILFSARTKDGMFDKIIDLASCAKRVSAIDNLINGMETDFVSAVKQRENEKSIN